MLLTILAVNRVYAWTRGAFQHRSYYRDQSPFTLNAVHLSLVFSAMILNMYVLTGLCNCTKLQLHWLIYYFIHQFLILFSYSIYVIHDLLVYTFWNITYIILRIPNNVIVVIDWLSIIGYRWLLCTSVCLFLLPIQRLMLTIMNIIVISFR